MARLVPALLLIAAIGGSVAVVVVTAMDRREHRATWLVEIMAAAIVAPEAPSTGGESFIESEQDEAAVMAHAPAVPGGGPLLHRQVTRLARVFLSPQLRPPRPTPVA